MDNKVLSIKEIELMNSTDPIFGKGITVASGFDLGAKSPLDSRSVARTIQDRDAHVTGNRAYNGMLVYVEENEVTYRYVNGEWEDFGFSNDKASDLIEGSIVNDLTTGGATKSLSAEQGKVLKGLVDGLDSDLDAEVARATGAESALDTKIDGVARDYKQADSGLAGRLSVIEGDGEGSVNKALEDAKAYADSGLSNKSDNGHTHNVSEISGLGTVATLNTGVGAGNVPVLGSDGKLDESVLPALAVNDFHVVDDQDQALELEVQNGDLVHVDECTYICVNSDEESFELRFRPLNSISDTMTRGEILTALGLKADSSELTSQIASAKSFATQEAERTASAVDTKLSGGISALSTDLTTTKGKVNANESAILKLNGSGEGSVSYSISKALADYSNTNEVKSLLTNIVGSLALSVSDNQVVLSAGGVEGIEISRTSLDVISDAEVDKILNGLN